MLRIISYYGAKGLLAKKYPKPEHGTIIEPFAGGASYSLLHYEKNVILYEINPVVYSVLKYVIEADPNEIIKIPLLEKDQTVDDLKITQEQKWLVGFWVNNAVAAPCKRLSKWAKTENDAIKFWGRRCRARVADVSSKIKHWKVFCKPYSDAEKIKATWFVDPPYELAGKHYTFGSDKINYQHLGDWCKSLPGQVIVCENEGAKWLPFSPFSSVINQKKKTSKEVVWARNQ